MQNSLSSSLLYKNIKAKIYRTTILPFALCGCGTRSLALRDKHRFGGGEVRGQDAEENL